MLGLGSGSGLGLGLRSGLVRVRVRVTRACSGGDNNCGGAKMRGDRARRFPITYGVLTLSSGPVQDSPLLVVEAGWVAVDEQVAVHEA